MKNQLRNIVITGASSGLGRALAHALADQDTLLILTARSKSELRAVVKDVQSKGGNSETYAFDIRSYNAVASCIKKIAASHGRIDVLINNAGWAHPRISIADTPIQEYHRTIATNLDGPFFCIKKTLPLMKKRKEGLIVNIASMAGKLGHGGLADYSASKFGILGLTQSVAWEIYDAHMPRLRIVAVCPGGINTPMRAKIFDKKDAERQQSAEQVAEVVARIVNGDLAVPNGGDVIVKNGAATAVNNPLGI